MKLAEIQKLAETRNGGLTLLARVSDSLERDLVPEGTQIGVDALLGARLKEGRHRPLPDSLVEKLERASLREARPLEVGLGEHGVDGAINLYAIRHEEGEASPCL